MIDSPARFHSILFDEPDSVVDVNKLGEPTIFADLNLDQVVESITAGREDYNLKPFFYSPLYRIEAIEYRHAVLRDIQKARLE